MARIAILSTAHIHTKAFIEILNSSETDGTAAVIWDDVPARGQRYAKMADCSYEPELSNVLTDASIDGFIICCENTRHLPLLRSTLPLCKPVFCEKPLVTSRLELTELRALIAEHPETVLIGGYFQFYDAALQSAKALIVSGGLGRVTRASYRNAHHAAYGRWFDSPDLAWFTNPALSGGGGFFDMGTHAFHALRSIFGQAESVWADIGNESGEYPACDDNGVAHLKFRDGVKATVEAGWTFTGGRLGLEVIGSEKSLWHDGEKYVVAGAREKPEPLELTMPARPFRVERLLAVIRRELSRSELREDLETSLDIVAWMEAAYSSAASHRWEAIA